MNTPHLDSEIRALIDQFTSKFRELLGVAALASVQMALEAGVGTPVKRGPGRPRGSGKAKTAPTIKRGPARPPAAKSPTGRIRRSSADVEAVADQILGYVLAYPGSRRELSRAEAPHCGAQTTAGSIARRTHNSRTQSMNALHTSSRGRTSVLANPAGM
jgi:hypothetical protein